MKTPLSFIKMHGLGNDFVVIDGLLCKTPEFARQKKLLTRTAVKKICDRRFGIGADQILWIKPSRSKQAVAEMVVLNADGTTAEMCGNGIRAVALYLHGALPKSKKPSPGEPYAIDTGAGLLFIEVDEDFARVNMAPPRLSGKGKNLGAPEKLVIGEDQSRGSSRGSKAETVSFIEVSMGNPHAVIFVKDAEKYPVLEQGPLVEKHRRFPKRTNVGFIEVTSPHSVTARIWERGAGLTMACGTGACAAAVAAIVSGRCKSPVEVKLPGGTLLIEWAGEVAGKLAPVFMSGPAEEVFRGEMEI
jgi:diaminopimelate epimerase